LRRLPGISPLLPPSSPYQYARTEGYFPHGGIAIRGARSVGERETGGRGGEAGGSPTLSPTGAPGVRTLYAGGEAREKMEHILGKVNNQKHF